ncbi:MAG TPA: DUF4397 domain-containing protein [Mucilaginibacter sp.]|nr:DUF4397 domain-containing protein [Mucilaginibacter sp.]
MTGKNKYKRFIFPFILAAAGMSFAAFISSCGKTNSGNVTPSSNIQYQVVNLSPDLGPVSLYINYQNYRNASYYYPTPSGYFYLTSIQQPFQIRPGQSLIPGEVTSTATIFSIDSALHTNTRYTLFITGLQADSSVNYVFLTDTSPAPAIGRGKVRFMNASPLSKNFDVVANGTMAFPNQQYLKVSSYIEMPAGSYNFQIFPAGATTPVYGNLQNVNIQDGRLYTIYTYGLAGRTDSLAFGEGVIVNK